MSLTLSTIYGSVLNSEGGITCERIEFVPVSTPTQFPSVMVNTHKINVLPDTHGSFTQSLCAGLYSCSFYEKVEDNYKTDMVMIAVPLSGTYDFNTLISSSLAELPDVVYLSASHATYAETAGSATVHTVAAPFVVNTQQYGYTNSDQLFTGSVPFTLLVDGQDGNSATQTFNLVESNGSIYGVQAVFGGVSMDYTQTFSVYAGLAGGGETLIYSAQATIPGNLDFTDTQQLGSWSYIRFELRNDTTGSGGNVIIDSVSVICQNQQISVTTPVFQATDYNAPSFLNGVTGTYTFGGTHTVTITNGIITNVVVLN